MKKVWTHQKRNPTEAFKCTLKMGIRQIVRTRIIEVGTPELRGDVSLTKYPNIPRDSWYRTPTGLCRYDYPFQWLISSTRIKILILVRK